MVETVLYQIHLKEHLIRNFSYVFRVFKWSNVVEYYTVQYKTNI